MKIIRVSALATCAIALSLSVAPVFAEDASALAQESGCLACHAVQIKVVGPAYRDVAAKYKGQNDALEKLATKVKTGGSGVWGEVPMPPNVYVSDEDIKTIVQWVLSL